MNQPNDLRLGNRWTAYNVLFLIKYLFIGRSPSKIFLLHIHWANRRFKRTECSLQPHNMQIHIKITERNINKKLCATHLSFCWRKICDVWLAFPLNHSINVRKLCRDRVYCRQRTLRKSQFHGMQPVRHLQSRRPENDLNKTSSIFVV